MSVHYKPLSSKELPAYPDMQPIPVAVDHLGGYRLRVKFSDGSSGMLDMTREVTRLDGRVIRELRRPEQFRAVCVDAEGGTLAWPPVDPEDPMTSFDFSPAYLYRRCVFGDGQPLAEDPFAKTLFRRLEGSNTPMVEPSTIAFVIRVAAAALGFIVRRWTRARRILVEVAVRSGRWFGGVLDQVTGMARGKPLSLEPIPAAQTFLDLLGSTDSHGVHSAAEEERYKEWAEALGGPYKGWTLRADYKWRDADEYCTLTFLDGSSVTCHIGSNGKVLARVSSKPPCPLRANELRRFIDHNERKRSFVETLASRPGPHIDPGTDAVTVVPGEERLVSERSELKTVKSSVWDWKKVWREELAKQKGTYGRD